MSQFSDDLQPPAADARVSPALSTGRAAFWTLVLSVLLAPLLVVGPFLAGWIGGRRVRDVGRSVAVALLPAILWAVLWYFAANHEWRVGKVKVYPAALGMVILSPATAVAILSGGLAGSGSRIARVTGMAAALIALMWVGRAAKPAYDAVRQLAPTETAAAPEEGKGCPDHLKKLHAALLTYADSYDGLLPPADRWMTALQNPDQRLIEDESLHCPAAGGGAKFGYAMNDALGGKRLSEVTDKKTPLLYDSSNTDRDAHDAFTGLPSPGRHRGKSNVLTLDGAVSSR